MPGEASGRRNADTGYEIHEVGERTLYESCSGRLFGRLTLIKARDARARDSCIGEKILCDSYTGIVPTGSISYGPLAFYPGEEAVMFGLLLALAGFVLMSLFIAYECLCGRL